MLLGRVGRPPTAVIVDCIDDHRSTFGVDPICAVLTEHGVSIAPSTSAAAKNALAIFRISLARFSSRFSRANSTIPRASSLIVPARVPPSISARRTQVRNASG